MVNEVIMILNNEISLYQRFRVVPYNIYNVKLYGVESASGKTLAYCDTYQDAEHYCKKLNNK